MKKLFVFTTALFTFSLANAHNIWFEPTRNANQYEMKFGHEQTETYPQRKIVAINLIQADGKLSKADYQYKDGTAFVNTQNASIIEAQFDNGVWVKLPTGKYVEKTKREEPSAEFGTHPIKFGKAILTWDKQATQSHQTEYELIPQAQPEAGKPLAILVLKNGKPVEGIKVGLGEDHPFNLTNAKGIAEFIPTKGNNKVWAEFENPVKNNPDYDRESVEYMLTFDVK